MNRRELLSMGVNAVAVAIGLDHLIEADSTPLPAEYLSLTVAPCRGSDAERIQGSLDFARKFEDLCGGKVAVELMPGKVYYIDKTIILRPGSVLFGNGSVIIPCPPLNCWTGGVAGARPAFGCVEGRAVISELGVPQQWLSSD